MRNWWSSVPTAPNGPADREPRRVRIVPGGPILVEGPVELLTPDGDTVTSDRFLVAICACRRSKRFPFCDTSHRKRVRSGAERPDQPVRAATSPD
ncbi:Zn-finger domain of CDGSH type-containing protein [Amycolatopsis marina]|uniref:Zn-finger domain of CDGSH type-containing protein n=1 Tax=Amycolatopsis marina TaxID=490629 RepID=A0A1I0X1R2_9PSEU|nr:CDGSH iron-sulfur domain-containing protein [Amycolatopsis marina]SFA94043.1 Zn-finger domain of CDGSH type-containing protein [Amycolatopsis marina]